MTTTTTASLTRNGSLAPGTEVVARYSFKGNSEEDLTFQKGDIITVITPTTVRMFYAIAFFSPFLTSDRQDPNWYKAKHVDGRIGLVPYNYIQKRSEVKLNAMVWFHGKISRDDAETLLHPRDVSDSFCVSSCHFNSINSAFSLPACNRMVCFSSENRQTFPVITLCVLYIMVKWSTTVSFTRTTS